MIYFRNKSQPKKLYTDLTLAHLESIVFDDTVQVPFEEEEAAEYIRSIRDKELNDTDWIIPITDHGAYAAHVAYRAALRAFPDTDSFPLEFPEI